MANYANLKTAIQQTIKQNGNEEITGAILQTTLLSMVDSLASGHLFKGIARPLFAPATTDGPAFYIALEAGSYINFTLTELGATAILREGYFGIFKTSGGSSNWTFTEVAISIKDGIVTTSKISNGAVTTDKIANGSITNDKIYDNAVSTQKIAPNAVTYNKIADGAVGTDKIADEAVTTDKIADDSITEQKLQSDSVNETAIQLDSIYERHIVDNEVTKRKLGQDVIEELENKANIDGSYESMSVGMAKNVEGTSPISGIFTFRPTAGNGEVASGVARTLKIGGNATQWNQMFDAATWANAGSDGSITQDGNLFTYTVGTIGTNAWDNRFLIYKNNAFINGHKYYVRFNIKAPTANAISLSGNGLSGNVSVGSPVANQWTQMAAILDGARIYANNQIWFNLNCVSGYSGGDTIEIKDINIFDLTLMFGYGAEPSSVAAFETWLQNNIGLQTYYPYNAGKLLSAKMLGIKTVGFNQWDEQWELGTISPSTGQNEVSSTQIRAKNYCRVIKGLTYYISVPDSVFTNSQLFFTMYDEDKNFIGATLFNAANGWGTRIFPGNNSMAKKASYIRFYFGASYGTTYKNDICINFHYINGRDGEYAPYEEHNYDFDTSKVYGKLNGEGNLVQVFPNGMRSAGTVHDVIDITKREAVVNIGEQNLADNSLLNWQKKDNAEHTFFTWAIRDLIGGGETDILTKKYIAGSVNQVYYNMALDKAICNGGFIGINDSGVSSVSDLIEALNGVYLWYVKSTPLVYTELVYRDNGADTPIDALNILVSNYGTEEQIVESPTDGEPNSCAATLDILYGVNAADFMDAANNGAFVSKASMESFLNTLGNAMNGVWSAVWNSSTGKYDFSFTPNAALQNENLNND